MATKKTPVIETEEPKEVKDAPPVKGPGVIRPVVTEFENIEPSNRIQEILKVMGQGGQVSDLSFDYPSNYMEYLLVEILRNTNG